MNVQKELANGVTITYLDESKKVAADRWLVKLRCRVSTSRQGWMGEALAGNDPQSVFCREGLGEQLVHETVMERNFIDEKEREGVLATMVTSLEETMGRYVATEGFVRQLFAKRLAELGEQFRQPRAVAPPDEADDPPGPADFSACFR